MDRKEALRLRQKRTLLLRRAARIEEFLRGSVVLMKRRCTDARCRKCASGERHPTYRKNGWPIGPGIVESVIQQLGKRLKGAEKHWAVCGAEATLQVMAHLLSEDGSWNDFWKRCPLAA